MTQTLESLLAELAAYLGTPDNACVGLPPAAACFVVALK